MNEKGDSDVSDAIGSVLPELQSQLAVAMAKKWDMEIMRGVPQVQSTPYKGDTMKTPGRVNHISIIPKTSGVIVEVRYDNKEQTTFGNDIEEGYACITLADTKEIINVWLREIFWAQEDYFAPEPDDEPVKRKRRARRPKATE